MSATEPSRVSEESAPAVSMRGIVKRFGKVEALAGVDFELAQGEIHGLLGENGAGKSTLMNILNGLFAPDAGTILLDGEAVRLRSPHDAARRGIGMVHQHFMLVPTLTVVENMLLGDEHGPVVGRRLIARTATRIRALSARYGLDIDPDAGVWQLSVGEQQRVEILRALYHEARVLVLDEPTATLTPQEAEQLLPRLRSLTEQGTSVCFITHHLDEVISLTDRITVLRYGKHIATVTPAETTARELARLMVGRDVTLQSLLVGEAGEQPGQSARRRRERSGSDRPVLRVAGVSARSDKGTIALSDASLTVERGEIVGIAGVEGNGQAELEEVLIGLRHPNQGHVWLDDLELTRLTPPRRLAAGLGLVPSDRYRRGLIRELSVADNLVYDRIARPPFSTPFKLNRKALRAAAVELISRYSIRASSPEQPVAKLSGGNAQRVVLARAIDHELRCLIAAQPTRGLDVGAIEFVWETLEGLRGAGVGVLLISTDLDEVLSLSDRVYVIYRGNLGVELERDDLSRERVGLAMGGVAAEALTREVS
jgi:simple sugar transport system ATP-binding protein